MESLPRCIGYGVVRHPGSDAPWRACPASSGITMIFNRYPGVLAQTQLHYQKLSEIKAFPL
jgi:hypothetical protein